MVLAYDDVDLALREATGVRGRRVRTVRQVLRGVSAMLAEGMDETDSVVSRELGLVPQGDDGVKPKRIQRMRTAGWRMPRGVVYVGRKTKWGNPFKVGEFGVKTAAEAVERYRLWLANLYDGKKVAEMARRELRGKDLACWCAMDEPCHADVLLEVANTD